MRQESSHGQLGIAGKLTRFFLENKELSALAMLILFAWGVISFVLMPKQYNPEIVAPAFMITTEFPNTSARETYELITRPMEDRIKEIPSVDKIRSQSFPGGKSAVTVLFDIGSDKEAAKTLLTQKLRDNMDEKPIGALDPSIVSIDPDDVPILSIGISSLSLSGSTLRKFAFDIADELKHEEGVSAIDVRGGLANRLSVDISAEKSEANHIALGDIIAAIERTNIAFAVGSIENDGQNIVYNLTDALGSAKDIGALVIREKDGSVLRLSDVARVSYGPEDARHFERKSDQEGSQPLVVLAVSKLSGVNATSVSEAVRSRLDTLAGDDRFRGIRFETLRDEGETAGEEISKLTFDLIKSIAIVGALLLLILGARSAFVAALSIPLVLLVVFGIGYLAGETVNRITLFALILSLELLVDDAIVVVENIVRYMKSHPKEQKSSLIVRVVDEVGGALFLSTFVMALAFFPMAFVSGMMGPYMGPIPFFVPVALFASLVFSVTLNPYLASLLLAGGKTAANRFSISVSRAVDALGDRYSRYLSRLLADSRARKTVLMRTGMLLFISILLPLFAIVPFRMLPKADKTSFSINLDLPSGTSVIRTNSTARELESELLASQEVRSVESFIGAPPIIDFNGLFRGSAARQGEHQATIKINLSAEDERDETSEEIVSRIRRELDAFRETHPDATIEFVEDPPGPPVLATVYVKVQGNDERVRETATKDIARMFADIDGVTDINDSIEERSYARSYRIDTEKAVRLGIAPTAAVRTLEAAFSGATVGLYHEQSDTAFRMPEQERIVVRFERDDRDEETDLSRVLIARTGDALVPITEILEKTEYDAAKRIDSDERMKTSAISAEMDDRSVVYAMIDILPKLLAYAPDDYRIASWSPLSVRYENDRGESFAVLLDGEWKLTLEVFRDLGIVFCIVLFLIYVVLAGQSRSFLVPVLVMGSIPLSLIGVLPGFALLSFLKGTYFNATSMIGVIALAGLTVKNAIIYLEYLEPLLEKGMPLAEALVLAGRIRLLPIALTSLAAILGSFTIITDPVWEGLAWAIIFGLSLSTVLTLIIFPLLYFVFKRERNNS